MRRSRRAAPARPRALPGRIVALIASALVLRLGLQAAGLIYLATHCDDVVTWFADAGSSLSSSSSVLPKDDQRVVLPPQPAAVVDPSLTGAGYDCLTESTRPMRIVGCYRYRGDGWSDIRYRVAAGRIVGFTLDGSSYDNGDSREFRHQAALIAKTALGDRTAAQVAHGVTRAIKANGPVAVDTRSADGWSGIARADADHWGNDYSLHMNSAGDRDGVLPRPKLLPTRGKLIGHQLRELGYDCEVYGSQRDCFDGWSPEESANDFTVISNHSGVSRLELSYQDQGALADYLRVLARADPDDARLLTAAVLRSNDGAAHHLVINDLMVAIDVGTVAVYGIDWPI